MSARGYQLLGFVVWKGARLYARRRYGHLVPSRSAGVAVVVGVAVLGLAAAGWRATLEE